MDVVRTVVLEAREVHSFEYGESLQEHRSLAPRPAGEDLEIAEAPPLGRADRRTVFGKVLRRQEPALPLHKSNDLLGDVPAVKRIARSFEPGLPASRCCGTLLVGHILQRCGEVGLAEHFAGLGATPVWQENRCSRG